MMTLRRRLLGLLALLLILGVLVGLPLVLFAVGANPFASGLPSLDAIKTALTSPDDGTLAVGLIKIVAWASWAFLTLSILVEVVARLRGVRAPRLPGLRLPQNAARGLVGTAMMLFVAIPAAGVANAAPVTFHPPTRVSTATTALATPVATPPAATHSATTPKADAPQATPKPDTVKHTVKRGETLWSIATSELGNGHRYKEILDLNRTTLGDQPGFIKAGWILDIPAPVQAPTSTSDTVVVEKGDTLSQLALEHYGDATRYPEIFEASRATTQPGGATLTDPDVIVVGWKLNLPPASAAPTPTIPAPAADAAPQLTPATRAMPEPAPAAPIPEAPAAQPATTPTPTPAAGPATKAASTPSQADTADHLQDESPWMARTSFGVGALLAAGVIALLATRRRTQQRRRRPGQRMPMPTGTAALVEQELRATADALSIEAVDVALRTLAANCTKAQVALPAVRAARLTATQFDLYLAEPAILPNPWTGTADDTVWTLEVDNTTDLDDVDVTDIPAPYPALVTIGHDEEDGHVLLDLEFLGTLGVSGRDDAASREILAALAIELANSVWADDLQVTLVGACPDLEDALQTGRIRYLPSVGRLLEDLLRRADLDREALDAAGAPDLPHARVTGAAPDIWAPEIVLLAGEITDRQRNQLDQLVTGLPRVALATVTSGLNVGEWGLDLTSGSSPDYAVLNPIGLELRPQRLPAEQYEHLLEIASLADVDELDPAEAASTPTLADIESIVPVNEPRSPKPSLPEVNFAQLEATGLRDAGDPAALPVFGPVIPQTARSPRDAEDVPQDNNGLAVEQAAPDPGVQDDVILSYQPEEPTPPSDSTNPEAAAPVTTTAASVESANPLTTQPSSTTPGKKSTTAEAPVYPMRFSAPRILVLGPVDLLNAAGKVEPTKRARLLEYAAYLALTPGATHNAIDDAIWPDRQNEDNLNTRNTATSKLRRWVGADPVNGQEYFPRLQAGEGYAFHPAVTNDVDDWQRLLQNDPLNAPSERLEEALALVRGIPFEGTHRKRYAWAEPIRQRLISEIVDASYELARRRIMEGRWRGAERAIAVGLRIEPAQEHLWRIRILAAHESRNPATEAEAIGRLLTITEKLECDLEPETEQLLAALKTPGADFGKLMVNAL